MEYINSRAKYFTVCVGMKRGDGAKQKQYSEKTILTS